MDKPIPAENSPFLSPYPPPADPALPTLKPFSAVDLAPPLAGAQARPQASPFLEKHTGPALPAKPAPASAPSAPLGPVASSDLSRLFAPASPAASPFAGKTGPEPQVFAAPAPQEERPAPRPLPPSPPAAQALQPPLKAPPVPPAQAAEAAWTPALTASATARRGAASEILPRPDLTMTDADAPAEERAFVVTTGPRAEGRDVLSYHGVVSVEIVIPKDLLFRNPAPYGELHRIKAAEDQLQRVKRKAFEELAERARESGANGIIGASLQFSQLDAAVFLCAALGTAVRLSE